MVKTVYVLGPLTLNGAAQTQMNTIELIHEAQNKRERASARSSARLRLSRPHSSERGASEADARAASWICEVDVELASNFNKRF